MVCLYLIDELVAEANESRICFAQMALLLFEGLIHVLQPLSSPLCILIQHGVPDTKTRDYTSVYDY